MNFYEWVIKNLRKPVMALYRIKVVGAENIPEGGCLVAANHTAFSDVILVTAAIGKQVKYMAKAELFKTPLKPLITALGAFPVQRGGADVGSIKKAISLLEEGELVSIFPQGHRHGRKDPRFTEIKSGIGMVAYHAKCSVLPVFIDNKRMKVGMFRKNTVIIGKPIDFSELGFESGGKIEYMNASKTVFRRVCELKYGSADAWVENPFEPILKSGGEQ